ncbi:hypothetical protein EDF52_113125 [Curtobacterium sp. PhB42]|uniref:hypothetical protein n=1 Tax=unclassified Curtobacterium TaxID=257496 RepID=UPI00105033E9|nr:MULTISPECIES: hypothetical protein [unclassified Curtobacterium]TCU82301.1 hypothetical protein EDF48_11253 [Curtobacterium sp. PhB191]TDW43171.1 hypothetical protein EDF52_113125 [Curtobacterium sp. PhB42]TDW53532.1 hypothetical protein EDF47_10944 [Curtobacterium sp. PhB190]
MARTSTKKDNRERARQRRAELDAERARRDAAIEEAASTFFDANDDREELIAKLDAIDVDRALAVQTLVELKETNPRIAQLLDIPVAEVRRLRDLGAESASANDGAASDVEAIEGSAAAEHASEAGRAA